MIVEIITRTQEAIEERDYRDAYHIKIDGTLVFSVSDGEPEDSNLSRDFSGVGDIPKLLTLAYQAGKDNESMTFEYDESADI